MAPTILLILDGWGIAEPNKGNGIELAHKPFYDSLIKKYPYTELFAHGYFVGLPKNAVGNSEAGHLNIGAGRVIQDDAVIISEEIKNKKFFKNLAFLETIDFVLKNKSALHLMGLTPNGYSPHSDLEHLYALVDLAHEKGVKNIYIHAFTDGRDSPQFAAIEIVEKIKARVTGKARIVSVLGRFYAMDRGKNWERTEKAYDCLTLGKCNKFKTPNEAILHSYNQGVTDEFIEPTAICAGKNEYLQTRIQEKDGLIFFNSRSDRARQLTKCFVQKDFKKMNPKAFKRKKVYCNLLFCALTGFGPDLDHSLIAYPSAEIKYTLPSVLKNEKQLYIAETEKYAHITYFINGGYPDPVNGEARVKIPSPKVKSYAMKPEMSVYHITKRVIKELKKDKYDFYAINFANPDMVGHTGNLEAVITAIGHVDKCVKSIADLVLKKKGAIMITADHGNAEKMIDLETNEIWTQHTTNKVPFILVDNDLKGVKLKVGRLGNVAPTIYDFLNIKKINKSIDNSLIIK